MQQISREDLVNAAADLLGRYPTGKASTNEQLLPVLGITPKLLKSGRGGMVIVTDEDHAKIQRMAKSWRAKRQALKAPAPEPSQPQPETTDLAGRLDRIEALLRELLGGKACSFPVEGFANVNRRLDRIEEVQDMIAHEWGIKVGELKVA